MFTLKTALIALLLAASFAGGYARSQPQLPSPSVKPPKPSQDLTWAHGSWVAEGEHPVQGLVFEWRVTITADGRYTAQVVRAKGSMPVVERGVWVTVDREVWSFIPTERDGKPLAPQTLSHELDTILAISQTALELRDMASGKVLRLARTGA